jgi:gliding motility-associated-like protein
MAAIITDNLRILRAKQFVDASSNTNYYSFIGLPNPEEYSLDWNISPLSPKDSFEQESDYWDTMIALKKIFPNDIRQSIRKIKWESGITYDMYRHDIDRDKRSIPSRATSLYSSNYYVVNSNYQVYICLQNGTSPDNPEGGTGPYTYTWLPNVSSGPTATGLAAGDYDVVVQDADGCEVLETVTVTQPAELAAQIFGTINADCFGAGTGEASVMAMGGTGPYTYLWNDPGTQISETATNLPAGNWTVQVTDANNCAASASVTIGSPQPFAATVSVAQNVSCNGLSDGIATVNVVGTPGITFQWNDPQGQQSATAGNLAAGIYQVTVASSALCDTIVTVIITEPAILAVNPVIDEAACANQPGQITANATGGTAPYTYLWSPGNQTTPSIQGMGTGSYGATVTDANGCTATATGIQYTQPSQLTANISQQTNVTCNGANDGIISVSASGGTPPYAYQWNDPTVQGTATATGLAPGNYGLVVLDANGCPITFSGLVITEPAPLSVSVSEATPITCEGGADGEATATISGGTLPYSINWSDPNGQQTSTATGLPQGSYVVAVTDANGCSGSATANIGAPLVEFNAGFSISPETGLQPLEITVTNITVGGTTFEWSFGDGNVFTNNAEEFMYMYADSGSFDIMLIATDDNTGCVDTVLVEGAIYIVPTSRINVPNVITPNGDGVNDMFPIDPTQNDFFPFEIRNIKNFRGQIFNRWGQKVYEWTQPLGGWEGRTLSGVEVPTGTYFYVITAIGIDADAETQYELRGAVQVIR